MIESWKYLLGIEVCGEAIIQIIIFYHLMLFIVILLQYTSHNTIRLGSGLPN